MTPFWESASVYNSLGVEVADVPLLSNTMLVAKRRDKTPGMPSRNYNLYMESRLTMVKRERIPSGCS